MELDYYERLLLNHRIGTIRPHVGTTQYYLSLAPGAWKTFNTEDQTFWCCTGSGVEEYAKLNDSIKERNEIVAQYNDIVKRMQEMQAALTNKTAQKK